MHHLTKACKVVRVMNGVVAGTSQQTGTAVDTLGFDGCMFILACGVISASAVTNLKAQHSNDDGSTDAYADIAGSGGTVYTATTDNNKLEILDIFRPTKRYVKPIVNRATGNAVIDGVIAILYCGDAPITQDTNTLQANQLLAPVSGTA